MTIQMYTNNSDNRAVNKSITAIGSAITCVFKDNTTLENPTVIISPSAFSQSCNYVYIDTLGRYYYVTDVEYSQQKCYLKLAVDVLMSFAADIKKANAVCVRSSNRFNNYFQDNQTTVLTYNNYYIKKFPSGFSKTLSNILVLGGTG